jgi:repressor LexA
MGAKLSDVQQSILRCLRVADEGDHRPTAAEIRDAVGLPSVSAVHKELDELRDKGFIVRNPRKPGDILVVPGEDLRAVWSEPPVQVPLLGRIAAGPPNLAEENVEDQFWLPRELVGDATDLFMLRTHGDSMTEAGISDGDYMVIHRQETAANGDIVVARLDEETTVKRFSAHSGRVLLLPANPAYDPMDVTLRTDVSIVGKVVAVIRTL